jgi:hypothetical protein
MKKFPAQRLGDTRNENQAPSRSGVCVGRRPPDWNRRYKKLIVRPGKGMVFLVFTDNLYTTS